MTSNRGRSNAGKGGKSPKTPRSETRESQAPSGVFRTSSEEQRWSQRLWRDGWTVAEQFIREGFYYRLLRRPVTVKNAARLTKREDDVLRLASAGHSNKSIAQALNVSASTVGVLLFRAAAKLNVASRSDLLAAYRDRVAAEPPLESGPPPPPEVGAKPKR